MNRTQAKQMRRLRSKGIVDYDTIVRVVNDVNDAIIPLVEFPGRTRAIGELSNHGSQYTVYLRFEGESIPLHVRGTKEQIPSLVREMYDNAGNTTTVLRAQSNHRIKYLAVISEEDLRNG